MQDWFTTSKNGLRKQAEERGADKVFIELVSNALDEREAGMTCVNIQVSPVEGGHWAEVFVEDNSPVGFRDLSHAYTIFADSYKRGNPELRGQFNFGEKLFLSLCSGASIESTTGTVRFDDQGRKEFPRRKRSQGTKIEATYKITKTQCLQLAQLMYSLLLPDGVDVFFNGDKLECRKPLKTFETTLPTMVADEEGVMRPTARKTMVRVYAANEGEKSHIYEMGIPVVETEIRWHISVGQKVPLNRDRDNVTPAYARKLCTAVAEQMAEILDKDDANSWCNTVLADKEASTKLVKHLLDQKFGQFRASYDPSDPEANSAVSIKGGQIIHSRNLTKEQWDNIREKEAVKPAGQVCPTPKPWSDDPDAEPADFLSEKDLTPGMRHMREYVQWLAKVLLGVTDLVVTFPLQMGTSACYGRRGTTRGVLEFNVGSLGKKWFDHIGFSQNELIIHELAHHLASDHYSEEFHSACCKIGAKMVDLALNGFPEQFGS
jgi:hypothetical protein